MAQSKTVQASTLETTLASLISQIQSVQADPSTVRYYQDRDLTPMTISNFLSALKTFQTLEAAAVAKVIP